MARKSAWALWLLPWAATWTGPHEQGGADPKSNLYRRHAGLLPFLSTPAYAVPVSERPFEWGFLWQDKANEDPKRTKLSLPELAEVLRQDLAEGKYILTGNLTTAVFADDCRFEDPNNAVSGLARYRQALSVLFDPEESFLKLQDISLESDANAIRAQYIAGGVLKLPWRPKIAPWSGQLRYTVNSEGLVVSQVDQWNITRFDALRQTFTPGR